MPEAPPSTARPAPITFTRAGFLRGVVLCLPLLVAVVPFGAVCGIASSGAGLSLIEATLMSATVYAGAAQLVSLANWSVPAPVLGAAIATFAINLRLALMGPVLAPWLDRVRGWRLWLSLFVMADQNWALAVQDMNAGGRDAAVLLGSGAIMWVVWVASTVLGFVAGSVLRLPAGHPLFFAAMGVFVSMLVTMWRGRRDAAPWLVAAAVSAAVWRVAPGGAWYIVAGALAGSLYGGLRDERVRTP